MRIQGQRIGEVWEKEIAGPLGLDAWIGLPESELPRLAQVFAGRSASRPEEKEFVAAYMQEQSPTRRAFDGLKGLNAIFEFNHAQARTAASPAFGGFASACGLAKFYAVLAGGGAHIFSSRLISWLSERLVDGYDEILRTTTAFTAGMQMDPRDGSRQIFGGPVKNFGHPGAGGSIAFADPERGWGVGLVLNQLEPGIFPNQAIRELMASIYF